ncbi:MAG: efflux transporter outer membrane subunit [Deltaproteobacteria bacterium]|nr:efflux transporter outer membrane subunit [Deltaproteobacteria bacterium]
MNLLSITTRVCAGHRLASHARANPFRRILARRLPRFDRGKALLPAVLVVLLFCGCTLTPDYTRPDAPVPGVWPTGAAYGEAKTDAATTATEIPWQSFFNDGRLQEVIALALRQNRDLRLASLNVERAQALYRIQRAELFPSVNAVGSMSKSRTPADLSSTGSAMTSERYDVNLGIASWEIDFFGRLRNLKDRALEEYLATEQAQKSAQILLIGAVANSYLALAADQEALQLATDTLATHEESYRLTQRRREVGMISELDLGRLRSQVEAARGERARSEQLVALDKNALQLLIGTNLPAHLLPADLATVAPVRQVAPGLSSEVLLNRPDVLAAEHRLKGAAANIGAARKAFLPRISLTSALGTASADLSGLFASGSGAWSFAPVVALPIFDARTWSAYAVTKVDREILLAQYEKAIQTAFREVADALAVQGTVGRQIQAQQALIEAIEGTYRFSKLRYDRGIDSYLSVLDAQRSLYAAQQGLNALRFLEAANRVTLYKVLGGGR